MNHKDLITCDVCGAETVPNVSTLDEDGYGWACINPNCQDGNEQLHEVEAEDLVLAGCPAWVAEAWVNLRDKLETADDLLAATIPNMIADDLIENIRRHLKGAS